MAKKKWVLIGITLLSSIVLFACGDGDTIEESEVAPAVEGAVNEGEHVDDFDVEFDDNESFEESDEDFSEGPNEEDIEEDAD